MADQLFSAVERLQGARPWGAVLDAGTGEHSLRWIAALKTHRWTAITGDPKRAGNLQRRFSDRIRPPDRILCGNWTDPTLLYGEAYDVVIADYLVGAIEGFAPYFQDQIFARLAPHVSQRLYVIGLEPYGEPSDEGGALICEIARLRDACILLAGHRCYREYPLVWALRNLERSGFQIEDALSLPIFYGARFINGQLDVCVQKLPYFRDRALASQMEGAITELRDRALRFAEREDGIRFGEDYIIAASPSGASPLGEARSLRGRSPSRW